MNIISNDEIRDALSTYGFVPGNEQCAAISSYISLLLKWNARISLTTVVDPIEILRFHFGESLYATVCVPILNGRLADLGSGAGFPGLPLRIALPDLVLTMIESNMKKAAFLREVARQLNLKQTKVAGERMENLTSPEMQFDYITARALGNHQATLNWARSHLVAGGSVVLWLGEDCSAVISSNSRWKWREPALIPGSMHRFILTGSPAS